VDWLLFAVQWLHVLLGILWFGYALSMHFLISPTLARLPEAQGRETNSQLGEVGKRVFPIVAILVLLLGIIRGTLLGPIDTFGDILGTGYGITWLVALVATVAIIANGAINIGPTFAGLKDTPDYAGSVARLRRLSAVDLALFGIVFTCMILMRFGV
jgi:uncharacterized membrane protein